MQDVTRSGTAARTARLGRTDLAGKTGTTNEFVDAWFAGYQPALAAVAWVGFDQPKTLGKNQTGSVVALPLWLGYMEHVLKGMPELSRTLPTGVVSVPTGPGLAGETKMVPEYFYREAVPPPEVLQPPQPAPPPAPSEPPAPANPPA